MDSVADPHVIVHMPRSLGSIATCTFESHAKTKLLGPYYWKKAFFNPNSNSSELHRVSPTVNTFLGFLTKVIYMKCTMILCLQWTYLYMSSQYKFWVQHASPNSTILTVDSYDDYLFDLWPNDPKSSHTSQTTHLIQIVRLLPLNLHIKHTHLLILPYHTILLLILAMIFYLTFDPMTLNLHTHHKQQPTSSKPLDNSLWISTSNTFPGKLLPSLAYSSLGHFFSHFFF